MKNLLLVVLLLGVADAFGQQAKVVKDVQYKAILLVKNDTRLQAFKAAAQKHLPEFIDSIKLHGRDKEGYKFIIKSDFAEGDQHEHMWSQVLEYNNGVFRAIFIDSPFQLKKIKTDDLVSIKAADVEDWAINNLRTKKISGDFSDRYINTKP